jgi:hypothetical protein
MEKNETILFAPLNWGLGHATRLVPLINEALNTGSKVIIAADGVALKFLQFEFPHLAFVTLTGYRIKYAPKPFFLLAMLLQMPIFYASIWMEHYWLKKIIHQFKVDTVISDNRYGLRNRKVKSILITHQLFIQLPYALKMLEPILHNITHRLIEPFNECWVPDYQNMKGSLSGKLSHGLKVPKNVRYINPLSRFSDYIYFDTEKPMKPFEVLVLISGPEPHRTYFEKEMENRFVNKNKSVLMVCGKPDDNEVKPLLINDITKVSHLNTAELHFYLTHAKKIIARSGYSTLMDLHVLNLNAELIATPGQTEQEYLEAWWKSN